MNVSTVWRRTAGAGLVASLAATTLIGTAQPAAAIPPPDKHVTIEFLDVRASDTEDVLPPLTPWTRPTDEFYLQGSVYSSTMVCGVGTAPVNAPLRTRRGIKPADRVVFDQDVILGDAVTIAVTAADQDLAQSYDKYRAKARLIADTTMALLIKAGQVQAATAVKITFAIADQLSHADKDDPLGNLTVSLPLDSLADGQQTLSWHFTGAWGPGSDWDYTVRYRITVGPPVFSTPEKELCVAK